MRAAVIFFILVLLGGCGPKEIGEGTSDYVSEKTGDASTAEKMRYPMTGANRTQQMLYYYNKPDVMQNYQNWRLGQFRRMMGVRPSPEDPAYRAVPRQRSPFRQ